MKRYRGDLEEKPDGDRHQRQHDQQVARSAVRHARVDHRGDDRQIRTRQVHVLPEQSCQVRGGRKTVEDRKSVRENAGTKRAQQKIFYRGFIRALVAAQETDEHVETDRHGFEAEELHHQVESRGHEHHSDRREQQQRVILAVIFAHGRKVFHRKQDHQRRRGEKQRAEENIKWIHENRIVECAGNLRRQIAQSPQRKSAKAHAQQRHHRVPIFVLRLEQKIRQQDAQPEKHKLHFGQQEKKIVAYDEVAHGRYGVLPDVGGCSSGVADGAAAGGSVTLGSAGAP